ncbi:MAG TPA: hypothetical protein VK255_00745 [Patescibacteria group bacterium]|nr:hypothetical protein [Patescibacteria group bacterium]
MKKFIKVILVIFAAFFVLRLIGGVLFFLPALFEGIRGSSDKNGKLNQINNGITIDSENYDQDNFTSGNKKTDQYAFDMIYPDVSAEVKNLQIDCRTYPDIESQYRKQKMFCENIYRTDGNDIKAKLASGNYDRIVLYGQYIIYNCPTSSKLTRDLVDGCYDSARFLDNYAFAKFATVIGTGRSKEKLHVYFEDDDKKIAKACNVSFAVGCYDLKHTIRVQTGEGYEDIFYPTAGPYLKMKSGLYANNKKTTYWFNTVMPKNCRLPSVFEHELFHYFDNQAYGNGPFWFEEAMARLIEVPVSAKVCPPGRTYINTEKEENGKKTPIDHLDLNDEQLMMEQMERWATTDYYYNWEPPCRRAIFRQTNRLMQKYGVDIIPNLYSGFRAARFDLHYNTDDIVKAVVNASGNDKDVKNDLEKNHCPLN